MRLVSHCDAAADIMPVYHFDNSQLLTYCGSEWLSRKSRSTVGMFWGWRGLPLPHQHDVICCGGVPIKGEQISDKKDNECVYWQKLMERQKLSLS